MQEAYDQIKSLKGLKVQKDLYENNSQADEFTSARPHKHQYSENFEEFNKNWAENDRRVFTNTLNEEEYERIKHSFEAIDDLKNSHFQILDIEVPNTDKRFNIDKPLGVMTNNKNDDPLLYGIVGSVVMILCIMAYFYKFCWFEGK